MDENKRNAFTDFIQSMEKLDPTKAVSCEVVHPLVQKYLRMYSNAESQEIYENLDDVTQQTIACFATEAEKSIIIAMLQITHTVETDQELLEQMFSLILDVAVSFHFVRTNILNELIDD